MPLTVADPEVGNGELFYRLEKRKPCHCIGSMRGKRYAPLVNNKRGRRHGRRSVGLLTGMPHAAGKAQRLGIIPLKTGIGCAIIEY
ncbi:MAG: hypothetical protein A2270_09580 [Elusimicrobia bacterium RIFOXYA12_FULL_51_18]|nr:MAG: hypothetical protein A2270_09580 [Elusimicrobia bacterium RIFOXYA12_FULL_51_18]OGS32752.1 MAG: hypothetical protein A2218_11895 [Elusimicrobia bacterium RIFOXYA2_FULL_53_38]